MSEVEGSAESGEFVFCGACGTRIIASVSFCTSCGESQDRFVEEVENDDPVASAPTAVTPPVEVAAGSLGPPDEPAASEDRKRVSGGRCPAEKEQRATGIVVVGYICAVLMPIAGAIIGAMQYERNRHGIRIIIVSIAMVVLSIVVTIILMTAISSSFSGFAAGGVFGGNGSEEAASAGDTGDERVAAGNGDGQVTEANLQPADGEQGEGQAVFGRVGEDEVVLRVTAEGLEPTPQGQSYTVWLHRSPELSLRVGSVKVGNDGQLGARFPIPAELLAYVASGAFPRIQVSRTSDAAYEREGARAEKQETLPRYSGQTVLRGKIAGPIVEAGQNAGGEGGDGNY